MAAQDNHSPAELSLDRLDTSGRKSSKWFTLNRSPLARKIILFNLIALGILVSGVLYLNQAQDSQVNFRSSELARQAEIMVAAIGSHASDPAYDNLDDAAFETLFNALTTHSDSIVQLYGTTGHVTQMFMPAKTPKAEVEAETDAVTEVLQKLWAALSTLSIDRSNTNTLDSLQRQWQDLATQAIAEDARSKSVRLSVGGEIFISVALPISNQQGPIGAILVSTREGEVDSIIRNAREQILQMFLLATLSSIVLSMVLANTIARPLRRLSAAAEQAQVEAGGKINLARVNIPDLTARPDEIGDLSRAMRNMTDALLDRIDENKSFAADVAHEIKNPLTSMRSAIETLDYVQDDESRSDLLGVLHSDVERLDRLVTDISNASRLEAELVRDTWEEVNICEMLDAMVKNFRARGGHPNVELSFEMATRNCRIRGLTGRLEQVFTNLISNALSFVPDDGWVRILVADSSYGDLLVKVSDNGPGIPEGNLEDIFTRFYSERPEAQFGEHSGLGLAITKQIVEAHGGKIAAKNSFGGGAEFTVVFAR